MNIQLENLEIIGLSHDGRGVAQLDGKTCFIADAIPGDRVDATLTHQERNFCEAKLHKILSPSPDRREPFCPHYEQCGGCQLQHLSIEAQRHWKAQNFFTQLSQQLNLDACECLPMLTANDRAYRRRARFALEIDKKEKQPRFGFRQEHDNRLVDIDHCPILVDALNTTLTQIRPKLLANAARKTREFTLVAANEGVFGLEAGEPSPSYSLSGLQLFFPTNGFIQVNAELNQQMVNQALDWLDIHPTHRVLDLFCGVGNFTLPLAQRAQNTVGVEGLSELVAAAQRNAEHNGIENCEFYSADLFAECQAMPWFRGQVYDRILLDPGRLGAHTLSTQLGQLQAQKIVYLSCNTATLIRDLKTLQAQGYQLKKACFIDMFAHTTHGEAMVLLEKNKKHRSAKPPQDRTKRLFRF
ncbi:MAG: 23S rRNA (uracil(1939)-C(5))-methyltransferase RlmD [Thiotrichales bacterium]|nr:23S rRNA (uracil(1939)-C(5))-methyltransferase RlmD [Thiotrichales bacterium]